MRWATGPVIVRFLSITNSSLVRLTVVTLGAKLIVSPGEAVNDRLPQGTWPAVIPIGDRDGRRRVTCGSCRQQHAKRKHCCPPHCAVHIILFCCGEGKSSTVFNVKYEKPPERTPDSSSRNGHLDTYLNRRSAFLGTSSRRLRRTR